MTNRLQKRDLERLFESLRNLVDQAEAAERSGNMTLARHATANLAFATQLVHQTLRETEPRMGIHQAN